MDDIQPTLLKELLDYDPKTGQFSWASVSRHWFASDAHWAAFRAAQKKLEPFSVEHSGGYLQGQIGGGLLLAHRAVWAYCNNAWPTENIDHINHDKRDNRLSNLRLATQAENMKNANMRSDNTSGCTGVHWSKTRNKWVAQIGLPNRTTKPLGRYDFLGDAIAARKAAEITYGFHPNHGKNTVDLTEENQ